MSWTDHLPRALPAPPNIAAVIREGSEELLFFVGITEDADGILHIRRYDRIGEPPAAEALYRRLADDGGKYWELIGEVDKA